MEKIYWEVFLACTLRKGMFFFSLVLWIQLILFENMTSKMYDYRGFLGNLYEKIVELILLFRQVGFICYYPSQQIPRQLAEYHQDKVDAGILTLHTYIRPRMSKCEYIVKFFTYNLILWYARETKKIGCHGVTLHFYLYSDCWSHVMLECRHTNRTSRDSNGLTRKIVQQPVFFVCLVWYHIQKGKFTLLLFRYVILTVICDIERVTRWKE